MCPSQTPTRFTCSCGKDFMARPADIKSGNTKSCGCLKIKVMRDIALKNRTHGETINNKTTTEYYCWQSLKDRCTNKNRTYWKHYGGRGITFCERWQKFESFIADMGRKPSPQHSLDRINVNGNYEPSNCRWATPSQQASNRRRKFYKFCVN